MKELRVGDILAKPGEMKRGILQTLELQDGTKVNVPLMVVNGTKEGPTLFLDACVHGTELPGIEVIHKIVNEKVDPNELHGSIISVPVANPFALQHCSYYTLQDDTRLDLAFPGKPMGRQTERIAYAIWHEAISKSDYVMDVHGNPMPCIPFVFIYPEYAKNDETRRKTEVMAEAFGLTVVEAGTDPPLPPPKEISNCSIAQGIPSVLVELMDCRRVDTPHGVDVGVRGVLNVMKVLGMLEGEVEPHTNVKIIKERQVWKSIITTNRGGLVHFKVEPGEWISKGTIIAVIYSVLGDEVEAVEMPVDGYIWAFICGHHGNYQAVSTGDNLCYVIEPKTKQ